MKIRQQSKYKNSKTTYNGEVFDSLKELRRYKELLALQGAGKIKDLDRQVKSTLLPNQTDGNGKTAAFVCGNLYLCPGGGGSCLKKSGQK